MIHVRTLLSIQQPTFQTFSTSDYLLAAWSAFHLKHAMIMFLSSECLLDHPMSSDRRHAQRCCEVSRSVKAP